MVDGPKNTAASVRQRLQNVLRLTKLGVGSKPNPPILQL